MTAQVVGGEGSRDGDVRLFLGPAKLEIQALFSDGRFPNVVVTGRGTVVATWGNGTIRARRSEDGGATWGPEIPISESGIHGGGTTVDETTGNILVFVEEQHPPAPLKVFRSRDDGNTWQLIDKSVSIAPDRAGNLPSMHMNEHGITLRRGQFVGRLLRPSRYYGAGNRPESFWPTHYTNAIFSDDHGTTWQTSEPFSERGTGEAALAELSDGRIYYNSRRHWAPEGKNPRRRWHAWSDDGGATWSPAVECAILPNGPQDSNYGCMGGLVRLPIDGLDILLYSNCDSPAGRERGTVWASFDGGVTWPIKRQVEAGAFAYSSLNVGRRHTASEGWIYLHYEGRGSNLARFNLNWILDGESTGDGSVPERFEK